MKKKSLTKMIPNTITLLNLSMGSISVFISFSGFDLYWAFGFIIAGAIFDFFDGFSARLLNAHSIIGKELDSLADLISFGLAPAAIMFRLILNSIGLNISDYQDFDYLLIYPLFSLFIVAFSALRLAKFNVDENQTSEFIGLPTPANAIFIASLVFLESNSSFEFLFNSNSLVGISILFSLLLTSKLPMFSFKLKSLNLKENIYPLILLVLSLVLLLVFKWESFPLIIVVYIVLNIIRLLYNKKRLLEKKA
ncbi:MAG: CDP-diacylglycerol--serine O-phosphatidyltransferase [Bacteroidales bacterium]|nr:CDP-diacylglycerol--serine O-phosphatidyltransferase [Bacteroidales bacterium]